MNQKLPHDREGRQFLAIMVLGLAILTALGTILGGLWRLARVTTEANNLTARQENIYVANSRELLERLGGLEEDIRLLIHGPSVNPFPLAYTPPRDLQENSANSSDLLNQNTNSWPHPQEADLRRAIRDGIVEGLAAHQQTLIHPTHISSNAKIPDGRIHPGKPDGQGKPHRLLPDGHGRGRQGKSIPNSPTALKSPPKITETTSSQAQPISAASAGLLDTPGEIPNTHRNRNSFENRQSLPFITSNTVSPDLITQENIRNARNIKNAQNTQNSPNKPISTVPKESAKPSPKENPKQPLEQAPGIALPFTIKSAPPSPTNLPDLTKSLEIMQLAPRKGRPCCGEEHDEDEIDPSNPDLSKNPAITGALEPINPPMIQIARSTLTPTSLLPSTLSPTPAAQATLTVRPIPQPILTLKPTITPTSFIERDDRPGSGLAKRGTGPTYPSFSKSLNWIEHVVALELLEEELGPVRTACPPPSEQFLLSLNNNIIERPFWENTPLTDPSSFISRWNRETLNTRPIPNNP